VLPDQNSIEPLQPQGTPQQGNKKLLKPVPSVASPPKIAPKVSSGEPKELDKSTNPDDFPPRDHLKGSGQVHSKETAQAYLDWQDDLTNENKENAFLLALDLDEAKGE
jgi:hypothetical protein